MDFIYTCEAVGEGKYVLFERGVGIRGMRKINEYTVKLSENVENTPEAPENNGNTVRSNENLEPSIAEMVVFAAEEMGVESDTILAVKIEQFAASSIDIRLICFTKTAQYLEWMNVKDLLAMEIKNIVEKNKASFAFPSTSIYVEKN